MYRILARQGELLEIRLIENRSFKILRENVIFLLKDAY